MANQAQWRSRGYLPHFDMPGATQALTFRLADSLPRRLLEQWESELAALSERKRKIEQQRRIAAYLDRGEGRCHLNDPRVAELVEEALFHFDGERYRLLGWCVMPNHVHAVVETKPGNALDQILHSWKSFSSVAANRILGRSGRLWQREYFDRVVRDERHLLATLRYVEDNPVAARLVEEAEDWRWSSAWHRKNSVGE